MARFSKFTLAAIQAAPVLLDRDASVEKACRLIEEAAEKGATIAAFGESWLPGYPFFTNSPPSPLWWKAAAEYLANAVEIPSPATDRLCAAAKRTGIDVVIGVAELDRRTRGTIYCTLLFIGCEGKILGKHRKLKPTHGEPTVWGEGDATGLKVYDRTYGRISGLNCWEHQMMLPGYALAAQGTQIHIAAWPGSESGPRPAPVSVWTRQLLLSRAYASQTGAYVIASAGLRSSTDVPERYANLDKGSRSGDSFIIHPRGEIIAGPAEGETILLAEGSLEAVMAAKVGIDIGGHYSRPDQLQLRINGRPLERLIETGGNVEERNQILTAMDQVTDEAEKEGRGDQIAVAG